MVPHEILSGVMRMPPGSVAEGVPDPGPEPGAEPDPEPVPEPPPAPPAPPAPPTPSVEAAFCSSAFRNRSALPAESARIADFRLAVCEPFQSLRKPWASGPCQACAALTFVVRVDVRPARRVAAVSNCCARVRRDATSAP
ncbi:hypothetical protein B7R21_00530 [Subtercola boreus]|uniref:Uncharacterized protein n=1 Tax=Subtercola boreus TaxID=120213 RepID=A0A3E0W7B1_9MICO|nr:hypothetical protein B7R21_00530 [Subtercola boreus]